MLGVLCNLGGVFSVGADFGWILHGSLCAQFTSCMPSTSTFGYYGCDAGWTEGAFECLSTGDLAYSFYFPYVQCLTDGAQPWRVQLYVGKVCALALRGLAPKLMRLVFWGPAHRCRAVGGSWYLDKHASRQAHVCTTTTAGRAAAAGREGGRGEETGERGRQGGYGRKGKEGMGRAGQGRSGRAGKEGKGGKEGGRTEGREEGKLTEKRGKEKEGHGTTSVFSICRGH